MAPQEPAENSTAAERLGAVPPVMLGLGLVEFGLWDLEDEDERAPVTIVDSRGRRKLVPQG